MKESIKFLNIIILIAIIGLYFIACSDTEGPQGPQGSQGPAGSVKIIDSKGMEVGTFLMSGSVEPSGYHIASNILVEVAYVVKNNWTFPVYMSTGMIPSIRLYSTGQNMTGKFYLSSSASESAYYLKNYVTASGSGYFKIKNCDELGYAKNKTESINYVTHGGPEAYTSSSGSASNVIEVKLISEAVSDSYFIGFTPTPPLRFQY